MDEKKLYRIFVVWFHIVPVTNVPTKPAIEEMKKEWRRLDLPEHLMRILHQAVQAYHRKEYAITVIVLSTQYVCLAQMCEALGFSVLEIPRD